MSPWWPQTGSASQTITVPAKSTSYVASYQVQYYLTTSAGPGGQIKPDSGWYSSGQSVTLIVAPNQGFGFTQFTGDFVSTSAPAYVLMAGPLTVKANFAPAQAITFTSQPAGLQVSIDGAYAVDAGDRLLGPGQLP